MMDALDDLDLVEVSEVLRVVLLEALLRPLFEAMLKNEQGHFGQAAERYTLHRFFVKQHGWFVRGLQDDGESWYGTVAAIIFQDGLPKRVSELGEQRAGGLRLGMHDLALLARTFERLVQQEAMWRLVTAYRARNLPLDGTIADHEHLLGQLHPWLGLLSA